MKGADHRSPNCIRKTKKYVLWNVNICPLLQFCENLFPRQNFTEIGQSHVELWSKTFFNMAAVHHIEFKKNHIWPRDCHRVPNMLLCIKFHQNLKSDDFSLRYGDFTIFVKQRISAILNFRGPVMGSLKSRCRTSYRSSMEAIGLKCLVFDIKSSFCVCILATDRQTNEQMDRTNA